MALDIDHIELRDHPDCEYNPEGCQVMVGVIDGTERWWTHYPVGAHPEHGLNLDHPRANDHRGDSGGQKVAWSLVCDACIAHPGVTWTEEHRREIAFQAAERGLGTHEQLAAAAGTSAAKLHKEAQEKGWSA